MPEPACRHLWRERKRCDLVRDSLHHHRICVLILSRSQCFWRLQGYWHLRALVSSFSSRPIQGKLTTTLQQTGHLSGHLCAISSFATGCESSCSPVTIAASGICRPCTNSLAATCDAKAKDLTWSVDAATAGTISKLTSRPAVSLELRRPLEPASCGASRSTNQPSRR